jgi:hypothetical protein
MKSNNWTFTRSDVYIDFNGNRVSKKQWLQNIPEDVIVASMTNPTTPPKPPVVGYKPKINPATGQPYKINPKTGLPSKRRRLQRLCQRQRPRQLIQVFLMQSLTARLSQLRQRI